MDKKAQEEIVGFVAIVLIIAIVAVIFLGIALRNDSIDTKESLDIRRFVDSSLLVTSDCAIGYEPNYASVRDLIKYCQTDTSRLCSDNRPVCIALNQTLAEILVSSWQASPESAIIAYEYKSFYSVNVTDDSPKEIIFINQGNCTSNIYTEGSNFFASYPGTITTSFRVCYSPAVIQ